MHGESGLDGPGSRRRAGSLAEGAVDFLARTIAESARPVTLVPTGPLTNIALLLERTGGANIERIVLMGGSIAEGNMTPAAEFNVWADPEAAQAVLHAGLPTTMIGLDVTHRALTTPALLGRLRAAGSTGGFVADLVDFFSVFHRETYGWEGAPIDDAVVVAHVIRPGIVTTIPCNVEVELDSELCRGWTVVDRWRRTVRPANAEVGIDLDADAFFELLVERSPASASGQTPSAAARRAATSSFRMPSMARIARAARSGSGSDSSSPSAAGTTCHDRP